MIKWKRSSGILSFLVFFFFLLIVLSSNNLFWINNHFSFSNSIPCALVGRNKPPFGFNGLGELVYRRTYCMSPLQKTFCHLLSLIALCPIMLLTFNAYKNDDPLILGSIHPMELILIASFIFSLLYTDLRRCPLFDFPD